MTDIEAEQLAERISRSWRGGIAVEVWYEVLQPLHYGAAEAAFRKLRETDEHQPSVARYKSAYNAQLGTAPDPRGECLACEGDGWITIDRDDASRDMAPCHCPAGRENRDIHARIITANDAELKRLGLHHRPPGTPPPANLTRHRKDLE